MQLSPQEMEKYTHGYTPLSEMVFVTRGLVAGRMCIGIKRWATRPRLPPRRHPRRLSRPCC